MVTGSATAKTYYIDGVKNCTGAGAAINSNGGAFHIGGRSDAHVATLMKNATMDDYKVWTEELTEAQVLEEYNSYFPPSISPTVSNLILTSAIGDTNNTYQDTPSINYSLDKAGTACMSNDSTGNYTDCISRGGLCSVAELDTKGVCTLQEIEKLTNYNVAQPLYFFANSSDDVYSLNYNNTIGVTLLPTYELSGNVKDSDGNLIEGALVTAELNNSPVILYNTTSDSIGEWTMNPSIAGAYTVCAYKPTNKTLRGDCTPFVMVP